MLWNGIPTIRKELAETLIKQFGLSQRQAAEKLGITPSAVCQYLSKKRGKTDIFDETIIQEITISAERIMKNDGTDVVIETCRICRLVQKKQTILEPYARTSRTKKTEGSNLYSCHESYHQLHEPGCRSYDFFVHAQTPSVTVPPV